jgi:DMSO/TMAO reductase YedYZ molybdopterin-dependent catalytic subunit
MGKATVLGLTSRLLESCANPAKSNPGSNTLTFKPGVNNTDILTNWQENTVDPQDVASIISKWNLTVDGLVENPGVLTFSDMLALTRLNQTATFYCVEGWSVPDVPWNGFHLSTLFKSVGPSSQATYVTFHTIGDTYNESLSMTDALNPETMMAFGINGSTLPLQHGFPLRLVIPYKWGYKSAKYVYRIELTDSPVNGYWEKYGYGYDGNVAENILNSGS